MSLAAFLITLSCTVAPGATTDECARLEMQKWEAPTMAEVQDCADMAESLTNLGQPSTCEVVPMAEEPEIAVTPKGPTRALNGKTLAGRNSAPAELSNRDLYNQRGAGVAPPKARFIMPTAIVPLPVKFMY